MNGGGRRRAGRPGPQLLVVALVATTVLTATPATPTSRAVADTDQPLVLVDHSFAIDPNRSLTVTVQLDPTADIGGIVADGTVIVTSHRPLTKRDQVRAARDGSLPNVVDTIDITPRLDEPALEESMRVTDPDRADAVLSATGLLTVHVPTETTDRTAGALQFAQAGIHPVVIEVRRGGLTEGVLVTFVDRLAADTPSSSEQAELGVGVVVAPPMAPTIAVDGTLSLDATTRSTLAGLADTLDAVAEALGPDGTQRLPALVEVDPSVLSALTSTDPALATRLAGLLGRADLTAAPRLPLDPSTAAAAGQSFVYQLLIDEGVATLTGTIPGAAPHRTATVVRVPLSQAGGELLEATGTEVVVMPFATYSSLDGSFGLFTDTTLAVEIGDLDLHAALIDPYLAEQVSDPGPDTNAAAVAIVAEIVVIAEQVRSSGHLDGHALLLGRTDLDSPDPALLGRVLTLLATTRQVQLAAPHDLVMALDTMIFDGVPVEVDLPVAVAPPDGVDPIARAALVDALVTDTTAVASMLPTDDDRRDTWATTIGQLVSTAVTDDRASETDRALRTELDDVRQCVVPPERAAFTLTGRTSAIPFRITNRCDVPVTVRIQLDSPKLSFPDGEQLVELAPLADTEVRAKAVARTNGRSSVFLRLLTPNTDGPAQPITPEVVLTTRVQSLAGVGQLLLGTLVLVVLAWWLRHWRDSRRRAQLASTTHHHPAAGPSG